MATPEQVIAAVSNVVGIPAAAWIARRRTRVASYARHVAAYLMRRYTPMAYSEIGYALGQRDHSTMMHSCRQVRASPTLRGIVSRVEQHLKSAGCQPLYESPACPTDT